MIENSPTAVWPRVIIARRLTIKKQFNNAFDALNELTNYAELPNIYYQTMALILTKSNESKKLAIVFENWLMHQPNNAAAYLDYINILDQQKNYKQALVIATRALQQKAFSNHKQLNYLEAYYLLATMQLERAHKKITTLVHQNPNHAFVLRLQGQLALARQDYSSAITYLSKSLNLNSNIDVRKYLVNAFLLNKQPADAINIINKQLVNTPNNEAFLKLLAETNIEIDPDAALSYYERFIQKKPRDYGVLNNLAWIHMQKGNLINLAAFCRKQ